MRATQALLKNHWHQLGGSGGHLPGNDSDTCRGNFLESVNAVPVEPPTSTGGISKTRLAILVFPFSGKSTSQVVAKLVRIAGALVQSILVVGPSGWMADAGSERVDAIDLAVKMHYIGDIRPRSLSLLWWVVKAAVAQLNMARAVLVNRDRVDIVLCTFGVYYLLPIAVARLLGKRVISASLGLDSLSAERVYGGAVARLIGLLARLNFALSDTVVVESDRLVRHRDLRHFRGRVRNGALFVGREDDFAQAVPLGKRSECVGFIGRLSEDKGVMEFLQAIPLVLRQRPNMTFLIIGSGALDEAVAGELRDKPWASAVEWTNWLEHAEIPARLNQLKLLVIPSASEGLPNVALEAMACGTPVLATAVGGLPQLIREGETGYLLHTNRPADIAAGLIAGLQDTRLEEVAANAQALVYCQYSFRAAVQRYRRLLEELV